MDYRDFINTNMNDVITALNGSITPAPVNSELYRDFLNRKADDVITALNGSITPAPAGDELYRDFIERKFDDVIAGIGGYIPPVTFPSVSGAVCSFDSQYAGLPLKSHKIALTATQSGSGTPSPSNPLPISGWSAINIGAVGKNFLETNRDLVKAANGGANTWTDNKKTISGIEVTLLDDGGINLNGTALSNAVIMLHTRFTVLDYPSTMKMYIGTQSAINGLSFRISSADLPGSQLICTNPSTPITIPDIKMNNTDVFIFVNGTTQLTNVKVYPMVLLSTETDTDYEPYNGTTATINFGSTIYGGNYDAVSGVLTADVKGILARDVTGWAKSGNVYYRNFPDIYTTVTPDTPTGRKPLICSHFDYSSSSIIADLKIGYGGANNNGNIVIRYDALSTISDFNDYITNNDVFIVYPLATPQTIQLQPVRVETQGGVNNIFADTGDTTLHYIKIGGNT